MCFFQTVVKQQINFELFLQFSKIHGKVDWSNKRLII